LREGIPKQSLGTRNNAIAKVQNIKNTLKIKGIDKI